MRDGHSFGGFFCAGLLTVSAAQCIMDLELAAQVYDPPDMLNRVEYLPLR